MRSFDMYRIALGYLVIIMVLCAVVVFNPLRFVWPANDAKAQVELASEEGAFVESEAAPSHTSALAAAASLGMAPMPIASPGMRVDASSDFSSTIDAIVGDLASTVAPSDADAMAGLSLNALAGLRAFSPNPQGPAMSLQILVTQALREGQSDAYIDALVNEAAGDGLVSVPAMLVTSDGRVDTAVLLAGIVARAQTVELAEGDNATQADEVVSTVAGTIADGVDVTHIVGSGDSLGSLALRFYGDSSLFPRIFEANRGLMRTPDQIRVGQVLIIPGQF